MQLEPKLHDSEQDISKLDATNPIGSPLVSFHPRESAQSPLSIPLEKALAANLDS